MPFNAFHKFGIPALRIRHSGARHSGLFPLRQPVHRYSLEFFFLWAGVCVVSAALLSKSELFLRLLTLTLGFNMTLFARVAKTASRTMVRQFHVEQRGIPGAVGKFVYVVTVSLDEGYSQHIE